MTVSFAQMLGQTLPQHPLICPEGGTAICQRARESLVGERLPRAFDEELDLSLLSDEALQERIIHCSMQMLCAHELGMKDERRRWWDEEAKALRERNRRPHLVAQMEAQRGLE